MFPFNFDNRRRRRRVSRVSPVVVVPRIRRLNFVGPSSCQPPSSVTVGAYLVRRRYGYFGGRVVHRRANNAKKPLGPARSRIVIGKIRAPDETAPVAGRDARARGDDVVRRVLLFCSERRIIYFGDQ